MLKSTYKPSGNLPPPLPPGWTEHKAPTGHTYYYNSETKESTYKRPGPAAGAPPAPPTNPHQQHYQYSSVPNLADPAAANAFLAAYDPARQKQAQNQHGGRGGSQRRGDGRENRPRPQPNDKPKSRVAIPGCEPWVLVYTKYGRRFAYNPVKNASYWRIPEKVMKGVLELDIKGIKDKIDGKDDSEKAAEQPQRQEPEEIAEEEQEELGSDYEEVEVTDDEDDENNQDPILDGEHRTKRQRTEDPTDQAHNSDSHEVEDQEAVPEEFNEEDIAFQLQAMGADYGLEPGEYDDGDPDSWPEGAEGEPLSDTDAKELFKDMLNDYNINPFSPWEKLIEEGRVFDDPRYTVLPTTKARKEIWDEWSREKIQLIKTQRETEEKKDPRIGYLAFLQEKATPKLYWPEFKRKYKREEAMRNSDLADKDREKIYRDHITRLKLPQDTLRKDLTSLLRSVGTRELNSQTTLEGGLPAHIITDVRYISLPREMRDELVQAYIQTLPGPPDEDAAKGEEEDEAARKKREGRKKREKALQDRERAVAEEKRRAQRRLDGARAMAREEERELEMAGRVDQDGLRRRLLAERKKESGGDAAGSSDADAIMEQSL